MTTSQDNPHGLTMLQPNEEQKLRLKGLALKVMSNFDKLTPYEMIFRVREIEKITAQRATTGYKMMRSLGFIPDTFVHGGPDIEKKIVGTYYSPVMCDIIDRFGLVIDERRFFLGGPANWLPMKVGEVPPGAIDIRTASQEVINKYLADYKRKNGIAWVDDTNGQGSTRDELSKVLNIKALDEEEEIPQSTIDDLTEMTRPHIEKVYKNAGIPRETDTKKITQRMTDILLGLDTNF